ncbi:hypothetical protein HGA89_01655 [bacterium]|nr:hypothetical protein [bacterium]
MIVFLNGKYHDARDARVGLFDGGYLYGDGVFETIRLYGGRPFDLAGHLGRLAANLAALDFAWRPEPAAVAAIVAELVRRNGLAGRDGRCRLNVSRGGAPEAGHEDGLAAEPAAPDAGAVSGDGPQSDPQGQEQARLPHGDAVLVVEERRGIINGHRPTGPVRVHPAELHSDAKDQGKG